LCYSHPAHRLISRNRGIAGGCANLGASVNIELHSFLQKLLGIATSSMEPEIKRGILLARPNTGNPSRDRWGTFGSPRQVY
jgi:hypothetical protein